MAIETQGEGGGNERYTLPPTSRITLKVNGVEKHLNVAPYMRADDVAGAVNEVSKNGGAKFIAGGTNLIDLMKENVARPNHLIDTVLPFIRQICAWR